MQLSQRVKGSQEFADMLLAAEMNAEIIDDGKYFIFPNGVVRDEYDRRRRERKREDERLREGMSGDSGATTGMPKKRVGRSTAYNFSNVPRRQGR